MESGEIFNFDPKASESCWIFTIRHLHISHNAPYLPPQILYNLCFSFLRGITAVPREIEKQCLRKLFLGANKVHYGKCGNALYRTRAFTGHISIPILISFLKWPIMV